MRRMLVMGLVLLSFAVSGRADAGSGFVADPDDADLVDVSQYVWGNDADTVVFNMFTYEPFSDSELRQWETRFDLDSDGYQDACLHVSHRGTTRYVTMYGDHNCSEVLTGASYERRSGAHVALVVPIDLLHRAGLDTRKTSYRFSVRTVGSDYGLDYVADHAWQVYDLAPEYVPPPPRCGPLRSVANLVRPQAPAIADVLCGV